MNKWLSFFILLTTLLAHHNNDKPFSPPQQIEKELTSGEAEFQKAKQMFHPWYSGPLLTGGGGTLAPAKINVQTYLYVADDFARYDSSKKPRSVPISIHINPVLLLQAGLLDHLDVTLGVQGFWSKQSGVSDGGYGDTTLSFGLSLLKEESYLPAVKIGFSESFPTGKYKNLNPNKLGLDSTGSGSFQSTLSFNVSKVIWQWFLLHPLSIRTSISYGIPSRVSVTGFNTYGGGSSTSGKVSPGNHFSANLGLELVIIKTFNIACDVQYLYTNQTTFSGTKGFNPDGTPAINSAPSNDQLSLAPALEYVPAPNLGFIAGIWFTVYGRNSSDFISGVISATYVF